MKEIWIFSFECAGVVKVGGLGEAVYNIAKHLAIRGFNVTLFIPSHGAHKKSGIKEKLHLQDSGLTIEGKIKENHFLPYRSPFKYRIGILKGSLDGFNVILFCGLDKPSRDILDETMVYRADRIEDKALLLARGTSACIEHLQDLKLPMPDILHAHDYHSVPAMILAKQMLEDRNWQPASMLTIHLLSNKKVSWNYLGEDWCGIQNRAHPIHLYGDTVTLSYTQILKKAKLKLEAFAAMEASVLASVSRTYLQNEVVKRIGSGCEDKTAFHWNGCDWSWTNLLKETMDRFGEEIRRTLCVKEIQRRDLRRYFLTTALGNLGPEEPVLEEGRVMEILWKFKRRPFSERGRVEPFLEDGPMVLMTGRLTRQKGVNVLFKAIPNVLKNIPNAKFVLLMLPLEEDASLVERFSKLTGKYADSVRIIFGKVPSIYTLAHLCADVFACPSEWEPFGIMALEAMATGNPVVATSVGGLKEIVIDARKDVENGTGHLIAKNDHKSLAEAITELLAIERISEMWQKEGKISEQLKTEMRGHILSEPLREAVAKQPSYGLKLRENAIRRVEDVFRWAKVIDMTINAYQKASMISRSLIDRR